MLAVTELLNIAVNNIHAKKFVRYSRVLLVTELVLSGARVTSRTMISNHISISDAYLESDAQCMAYILARWPLSVRRVLICILPTGSIPEAELERVVSAAAFRAS